MIGVYRKRKTPINRGFLSDSNIQKELELNILTKK